jgi:flagellar biosynthesis component FlhA
MALESSGGFRSSSSPVKLRSTSLVVLSAGAALVALIGYLYMKSRQSKEEKETTTTEKTKRKVVSKEEKENSHKEVEEEETELVMSIVDTETVVVDKETKSSCCHKKEEDNCSEIVEEEVDFESISRDLVRIVLNCAVKKMVHENDELTHLMRYIYNCAIIYEKSHVSKVG